MQHKYFRGFHKSKTRQRSHIAKHTFSCGFFFFLFFIFHLRCFQRSSLCISLNTQYTRIYYYYYVLYCFIINLWHRSLATLSSIHFCFHFFFCFIVWVLEWVSQAPPVWRKTTTCKNAHKHTHPNVNRRNRI